MSLTNCSSKKGLLYKVAYNNISGAMPQAICLCIRKFTHKQKKRRKREKRERQISVQITTGNKQNIALSGGE